MPPLPPGSPRESLRPAPSSACCLVLPLVPGLDRPPATRRPLPDAAAVRLVVVPDSAPPYDDERAPAGQSEPGAPRPLTRQTAAQRAAPGGQPARPDHRTPAEQPAPPDDRTPAGRAVPAEWPSRFAQVLAETLAGSRPPGQLAPWTTDQARKRIRQLGPTLAAGVQPRVRRVVTSRPTSDVVEMTVIVGFGPRVRALAVRLERDGTPARAATPGRWVCTAIEAA
jgi:hypothetical protein